MEDILTKEKGALSLRNLIMLYNVVKRYHFHNSTDWNSRAKKNALPKIRGQVIIICQSF